MPDPVQRLVALAASVVTFPLVAMLAVAIRLESGPPALFQAVRIGEGARPFTCYKLRSMRPGTGPNLTGPADARVTRVGRLLRRFRLDELPQLWNVARGEMLLIGPRPEDPRFVNLEDPLHRLVFTARPGITGLTQLAYLNEAEMLDQADPERHYREVILPQKLRLDADYLRRRSVGLDVWILAQTVCAALGRPPSLQEIETHR